MALWGAKKGILLARPRSNEAPQLQNLSPRTPSQTARPFGNSFIFLMNMDFNPFGSTKKRNFLLSLGALFFLLPTGAEAMVGIELMGQESRWKIDQLSTQESVTQVGTYLYFPLGSFAFVEAAHEQLDITFKTLDPLKQGDNSAVLNLILGPVLVSAGTHLVLSSNNLVDQGHSTAYAISLPEILHLSLGYSQYETTFPNMPLTDRPGEQGLKINQTAPEVGISFFDGLFSLSGQQDNIVLADSLGLSKTQYRSTQGTLSFWAGPMYFGFSGWNGERLFFADNKGLYLNSLGLIYQGGNRAAVTWMIATWMDLALIRTNETFLETEGGTPLKAQVDTVNLTFRF